MCGCGDHASRRRKLQTMPKLRVWRATCIPAIDWHFIASNLLLCYDRKETQRLDLLSLCLMSNAEIAARTSFQWYLASPNPRTLWTVQCDVADDSFVRPKFMQIQNNRATTYIIFQWYLKMNTLFCVRWYISLINMGLKRIIGLF